MHVKMSLAVTLAGTMLVLAACSSNSGNGAGNATASPSAAPADNGQMIFQTGIDSVGKRITAANPPLRPSCKACHNANGSGGVKLPAGAVSADLRYDSLVTKQKPPYTLALVERAIWAGIDNQGKKLDPVMPHWKLSKADLHDVAAYVLTLK